jgi:hypothetical protein
MTQSKRKSNKLSRMNSGRSLTKIRFRYRGEPQVYDNAEYFNGLVREVESNVGAGLFFPPS